MILAIDTIDDCGMLFIVGECVCLKKVYGQPPVPYPSRVTASLAIFNRGRPGLAASLLWVHDTRYGGGVNTFLEKVRWVFVC